MRQNGPTSACTRTGVPLALHPPGDAFGKINLGKLFVEAFGKQGKRLGSPAVGAENLIRGSSLLHEVLGETVAAGKGKASSPWCRSVFRGRRVSRRVHASDRGCW